MTGTNADNKVHPSPSVEVDENNLLLDEYSSKFEKDKSMHSQTFISSFMTILDYVIADIGKK